MEGIDDESSERGQAVFSRGTFKDPISKGSPFMTTTRARRAGGFFKGFLSGSLLAVVLRYCFGNIA